MLICLFFDIFHVFPGKRQMVPVEKPQEREILLTKKNRICFFAFRVVLVCCQSVCNPANPHP